MFTTISTGKPNNNTTTYKIEKAGNTVYKARKTYDKDAKQWRVEMRDMDGATVLASHTATEPARDAINLVLETRARQLDGQTGELVAGEFNEMCRAAEEIELNRDDETVRREHVLRTLGR
ncbi:hypothetical protein [Gleimia europaea]|uniref:hypothetical protein n=1 Tax=Gleimia europaea TaxID=66228 RepID=UPI000C80A807|nr:hypothetical protein [Gleimia europaea]WIK62554.1 hypothetical protein CJ185_008575 [Gleimia europaea]